MWIVVRRQLWDAAHRRARHESNGCVGGENNELQCWEERYAESTPQFDGCQHCEEMHYILGRIKLFVPVIEGALPCVLSAFRRSTFQGFRFARLADQRSSLYTCNAGLSASGRMVYSARKQR
jgi:hypothetical protein